MQLKNYLIVIAVCAVNICVAQTFVLGQGGATITTCSGNILDPGGAGAYINNENVTQTFCSGTADCIQLSVTSFQTEANWDFLRIYDGIDNTAEPLFDFAGIGPPTTTVTGTTTSGGCLTLNFTSDGSVTNPGFDLSIQCVTCPVAPTVFVLGQGSPTINTCTGIVRDPGGGANYGANLNVTQTFCSDNGQCVQFAFEQFQTETNGDIVRFFDGPTVASPLIDDLSGFLIPTPITSSVASGGCLTVQFISNAFNNNAGFMANITCVPCSPPPQTIILGQGGATIQVCNGILQDPGGIGSYADNENVTQTICSGNAQCIQLTFSEFQTEATFDRLTIYDGASTSAELLGIFSGFNIPVPVRSSTASGGCMTLVFSSNGSFSNPGFEATISCVTCPEPIEIPTGNCGDAQPFCTEAQGGLTFPAATSTQSEFGGGICCLGSTPNPAWYFMRIQDAGSIDILITSGFDVDFACWGPFTEAQWQNGVCAQILDLTQSCTVAGLLIDCSYSGAAFENCNIPNGQVGEYYMLLLTNFSNQVTNINFSQNGGTGTTDCSIFCQVDAPALPTVCDPVTNTYTLSGTIEITNPPLTGTLTLANSSGSFTIFNAPFANSIPYNYINLSSNGNPENLSVVFSDNNTCANISNYTAPVSCSTCPVTASVSGPACNGQNVTLTATNVDGATYSWTGPNGYTSTDQNPTLTNVNLAMAGVYTVTANDSVNVCGSIASVNVLVQPVPLPPIISNNSPVCRDSVLKLYSNFFPFAIYNWTGPNLFNANEQNPIVIFPAETFSGEYSCSVSINGCVSESSSTQVEILSAPDIQDIFYDDFNNILYSNSEGVFFRWLLDGVTLIFDTIPQIPLNANGIYQLEVTYENGCTRRSQLFNFNSLGFNQLKNSQISIFPNPSNGQFNFQTEEKGMIEMFDLSGKLTFKTHVIKGKTNLNIMNLAAGFYILKFSSKLKNQFGRIYIEESN